jgi:2'-5' RNA ligase
LSAALRQPEVVRAFFAIELDAAARSAAAEVSQRLRPKQPQQAVRWVSPENYHVTLRFLGNLASESLDELLANAARELQDSTPFELELTDTIAFPQANKPRAVVLGLEPHAPIAQLAAAVERGAVASGQRRERRGFRSHLTLGRVRRGVSTRDLQFDDERPEPVLFPVREVVLFRSQLTQSGPEYTALGRLPLGASVHPFPKDLED